MSPTAFSNSSASRFIAALRSAAAFSSALACAASRSLTACLSAPARASISCCSARIRSPAIMLSLKTPSDLVIRPISSMRRTVGISTAVSLAASRSTTCDNRDSGRVTRELTTHAQPNATAIPTAISASATSRSRIDWSITAPVTVSLAFPAAYITSSSVPICGVVVSTHCAADIGYFAPAALALRMSLASERKSLEYFSCAAFIAALIAGCVSASAVRFSTGPTASRRGPDIHRRQPVHPPKSPLRRQWRKR